MKTRTAIRFSLTIVLGVLLLSSFGCTHVWEISKAPVALPEQDKIDLRVNLCITEEFRNAKWEKKSMGDTFIIPFGEAFCGNAEAVAKALFTHVRVTDDPKELSDDSVDAVLQPKVIAVNRDRPVYGFQEQTTTVILEWSLRDRDDQLVWIDTITGFGTGPLAPGASQKKGATRQATALMHDLFWKSYEGMYSSVEIKEFAAARYPQIKRMLDVFPSKGPSGEIFRQ